MLQVFVAFTKDSEVARLERTLEAWDLPGMEPSAIQCGLKKFELHRRVSSENVSRGTYVLVRLDHGPVEPNFAELAEQLLADDPQLGMIEPKMIGAGYYSGNVAICRKGVVKQWVHPLGSQDADELWANAHRTSVRNAGYKVMERCPTIHYQALAEFLPSSSGTAKPD